MTGSGPPRVAVVGEPDAVQRAELAKTPRQPDGRPLNLFATLAHRPALLRRVNALGGYFSIDGTLPARQRELAILRTAAGVGSAYEQAHHQRLGAELGLTAAEIEAVLAPCSDHRWSSGDRAVIAAVDELLSRHTVSDQTWSALEAELGESQRLELLILAGFYAMLGGMLNAVAVELEPGLRPARSPGEAQVRTACQSARRTEPRARPRAP